MGQILSHGVYLPNEGERNCYAGLASNWQILNTAVGAIAEKAPLVHTHTVSQITDFPAYGNAAGTICEGNDSRLSDARTPVAHTHTKSDVTDLFNSANTWTGTNTFTANNLYHIAEDPNNILKSSTMQEGVVPSGNRTAYAGYWQDKNAKSLGYGRFVFYTTGAQAYEVNLRNKATNGSFDSNGSLIQSGYQLALFPNGNSELKIYAHTSPNGNGVWNLGDPTHKWKTLNGVNPGALSLPGAYQAINDQIKDPNGQLNAFDLNGGSNTWVSDVDCYLYFYIPNNKFTWIRIFWPPTLVRCGQTFVPVPNESSDYSGFVPVPANTTVVIQVKGTQAPVFRRSACLGNV